MDNQRLINKPSILNEDRQSCLPRMSTVVKINICLLFYWICCLNSGHLPLNNEPTTVIVFPCTEMWTKQLTQIRYVKLRLITSLVVIELKKLGELSGRIRFTGSLWFFFLRWKTNQKNIIIILQEVVTWLKLAHSTSRKLGNECCLQYLKYNITY